MRSARTLLLVVAGLSLLPLLAGCSGKKQKLSDCPVRPTPIERFSLCLTDGWRASTEQMGTAGSIIVSIKPANNSGTLMQIHVKKDPLQEDIGSSMEFAERAVAITRQQAPHYVAVGTEPMTIAGEQTLLHTFDATPDPKQPPVRYYQFVTTNAGIGYGFTAVISPKADADMKEVLLAILKSARFL